MALPLQSIPDLGRDSAFASRRLGRVDSTIGYVTALSLVVSGAGLGLSCAVTLLDDRRALGPLALVSGVSLCAGFVGTRVFRPPPQLRTTTAFGAVAAIFLTMIGVSTATYLVVGTFDTLADALFESVAGFTTTASSVLDRPEHVARGVVFWRAATQWLGGFLSLVVVVALLPFLGVGGVEVSEVDRSARRFGLLSPRTLSLSRRLATTYLALTAVGGGLFLAGGMGPFDSVTYALTTISTGGFQNHAGSFAYFDSALIEWLAVGGMVLAGANIALLARTLRGQLGPLQRSAELRTYGLILLLGTLAAYWLARPSIGSGWTQLRQVAFSVVSAVSTTGASVTDWGMWPAGPQVLLLLLMGVGAMSGSTGGGFRIVRAMALIGYVRRELKRALYPRSVAVVKVGRVTLDETLVSRLIGYQVLFVAVVGAAAVGIALFEVDLTTSVSVAISTMSNVGPALGDLSPAGGADALPAGARLVLIPVMLLGRLEIAPILVGVVGLVSARRRMRRAAAQLIGRRS